MRINTNVAALNAYRNLSETNNLVASSMQKLSSGFRINRAADDAAGLGIANRLRADTRAMTQASKNAEQANSVLQITEGATTSVQKMLERMKELATQAGSDSVDDSGRSRIKAEYDQLRSEIQRTADTTKFQGKELLKGGAAATVSGTAAAAVGVYEIKQSGAEAGAYTITAVAGGLVTITNAAGDTASATAVNGKQTLNFASFGLTIETDSSFLIASTTLNSTGITVTAGSNGGEFLVGSSGAYATDDIITLQSINLTTGAAGLNLDALTFTNEGTTTEWRTALTSIDSAMNSVNEALGSIGASQNRIENALSNLKTSIQNFSAAESVIRDLDMAEEMTKFSKNNILAQAGTAMLAQANQSAQGVLQLLRG